MQQTPEEVVSDPWSVVSAEEEAGQPPPPSSQAEPALEPSFLLTLLRALSAWVS